MAVGAAQVITSPPEGTQVGGPVILNQQNFISKPETRIPSPYTPSPTPQHATKPQTLIARSQPSTVLPKD